MTTTSSYLPAGLPAPANLPGAIDREFWEGTASGRLMVQICKSCSEAAWPPEEICSRCHSFDRDWVEASGKGSIYSWTRIWHPVHPALNAHGPYVVVVVALDDFPVRIVGNLLGDPEQAVTIGMAVNAVFEPLPGGAAALVQWQAS